MHLLFIRHGDPDYEHDSLTEAGEREAAALADYMVRQKVDYAYVSPLGRAQKTAAYTLSRTDWPRATLPWLREFDAFIHRPDREKLSIPWDWLPEDWTKEPLYYDPDQWWTTSVMREGHVKEMYDQVAEGLDAVLKRHGYVRSGRVYEAQNPSHETIAFFCHFGVTCVMLSHLLGISPMPLWHGMAAPPSSISSLYTEERREGIASFRMNYFGATPHLLLSGTPVSKHARFCECFSDAEDRHD